MKRHWTPPPRPTEPSLEYAVAHRVLTTLCGTPTDRFAGCSFPTCPCDRRCAIYDAGREDPIR